MGRKAPVGDINQFLIKLGLDFAFFIASDEDDGPTLLVESKSEAPDSIVRHYRDYHGNFKGTVRRPSLDYPSSPPSFGLFTQLGAFEGQRPSPLPPEKLILQQLASVRTYGGTLPIYVQCGDYRQSSLVASAAPSASTCSFAHANASLVRGIAIKVGGAIAQADAFEVRRIGDCGGPPGSNSSTSRRSYRHCHCTKAAVQSIR